MPSFRPLVPTLLALAAAGCATSGPALPAAPPPEEIPRLESRLAARPDDAVVLRRLGAAERAAGRAAEAAAHLERSAGLDPSDPGVHFFLALAYEDLDRPGDAIDAYRAYLERADGDAPESVEARIRVLRRQQLRQAVREALAREGELVATLPEPNTVAVFPFVFTGTDASLEPLGRALAGMLTADLSQTDRLRVLERLNAQLLLDEMALGESGWVESSTAARSGYLLGARNIVQGRIDGDLERLSLDAAVVTVTDPETGERRPVSLTDAGERLLAMEKELALGIYEALGIVLTPAERERVTQRRTESVQALLAYGRGLEASDRGDFALAAQHFREAAAIDPDFEQASQEAEQSEAEAEVADASTDEMATLTSVEPTVPEIPELVIPTDIEGRDPGAELGGTEQPTSAGPAVLIIRPGGGGGDR